MPITEREAARLNRSMPVAKSVRLGDIIRELQMREDSGIADGSVTTEKIADGAVTDDKLANPKVDVPNPLTPKMVLGTTLESNTLGMVGYSQEPMADQLVMYQFGGQIATADPQDGGDAATKRYVDSQVSPKLTATQAAAVADSSGASDVTAIESKINELLASLRAAGIMASS